MDDQNGAINWLISQRRIQASASVRNGNATVNHEEIVGFIDQAVAALILQPKDPAEVGAEVASAARALLDACYKADENSDLSDFVDGMLLTRLDKALRARSSAPEAREGVAVAWTHELQMNKLKSAPKEASVMWGAPNGSIKIPLYTHPAAPSADKLREVLVDLTSWFTKLVQGQSGMVWVIPAGERGADDALNAALAALKAEV